MMRILYINNINEVAETYKEDMIRLGHFATVYEPSLAGGAVPLPSNLP